MEEALNEHFPPAFCSFTLNTSEKNLDSDFPLTLSANLLSLSTKLLTHVNKSYGKSYKDNKDKFRKNMPLQQ